MKWNGVKKQIPTLMGTVKVSPNERESYVAQWICVKREERKRKAIDWASLAWPTVDSRGKEVFLPQKDSTCKLVVFSKGFSCAHCSDQINSLLRHESDFSETATQVLVVVPDDAESLAKATASLESSIQFVADPNLIGFAKVGCNRTNYSHGIFLFEANSGACIWKDRGTQPYLDMEDVLTRIKESQQKSSKQISQN